MTKRVALFVLEGDNEGNVFNVRTGEEITCATCRWAEHDHERGGPWAALTMRCTRPCNPEYEHAQGSLAHWYEDLIVAPTFGCVQWEGKA